MNILALLVLIIGLVLSLLAFISWHDLDDQKAILSMQYQGVQYENIRCHQEMNQLADFLIKRDGSK